MGLRDLGNRQMGDWGIGKLGFCGIEGLEDLEIGYCRCEGWEFYGLRVWGNWGIGG